MQKLTRQLVELVVISGGLMLAAWWWKITWLLCFAAGILILGVVNTSTREWILRIWSLLGKAMGFFSARVLLIVLFVCVLTPTAVLARVFRRHHPLRLRPAEDTMFVTRTKTFEIQDFERSW